MAQAVDWHLARALLEWQVELGATDAILAHPVDRFAAVEARADARAEARAEIAARAPVAAPAARAHEREPSVAAVAVDPVAEAVRVARGARDLAALAEALEAFSQCELKRGARSCVFADGNPAARVMIVGEGPGADEDRLGRPFVGRAGQLLDAMFAAIGLSRSSPDPAASFYVTNTVPWRPPMNREPTRDELAMLRPFLMRHIELVQPDILVLVGNVACDALLEQRGILRLRGKWTEALGLPALPMLHPAYLLRTPAAKRESWADLLALRAKLRDLR